MILVDSSVWIDYFNGVKTRQTDRLEHLIGVEPLAAGDLILAEVLQGFRRDRDFEDARRLMASLESVELCGRHMPCRQPEILANCAASASPSVRLSIP